MTVLEKPLVLSKELMEIDFSSKTDVQLIIEANMALYKSDLPLAVRIIMSLNNRGVPLKLVFDED